MAPIDPVWAGPYLAQPIPPGVSAQLPIHRATSPDNNYLTQIAAFKGQNRQKSPKTWSTKMEETTKHIEN